MNEFDRPKKRERDWTRNSSGEGREPLERGEIMRIRVLGAAGEVTGSNYLLDVGGKKVLVDCGLYQGGEEGKNREPLEFEPSELAAVILTHAHLDHTGRVPLLVKEGFSGPVFGTRPTLELSEVLWEDAARLQKEDAEWKTRKNQRKGLPPVEPLFTTEDARQALEQLRSASYDDVIDITDGVKVRFRDAGHILGSANLELWLAEGDEEVKIVFSGDLGPQKTVLERNPSFIEEADYVVIESTYGNREHKTNEESREEFRQTMRTMLKDHGKVLVPTFVVDRAQRVLYELTLMQLEGILPDNVPIYFDSPMGMKATAIYNEHVALLSSEIQDQIRNGTDPFSPKQLRIVESVEESKAINSVRHAIVLAGSGMCTGGRIVHHLKNNLYKEDTHVVFVGYQARGTLGRRIVEGAKTVRVAGEEVAVNAKIHTINGFSAHADRRDLLAWARNFRTEPTFFVTHGEEEAAVALASNLEEEGFKAVIPTLGQEFELKPSREAVAAGSARAFKGFKTSKPEADALLSEIEAVTSILRGKKGIDRREYINLLSSARTLLETVRDKIEETGGGETVL
ncbi:MAG: RNA-metabolising metallo-beta-lactamase [Synergistales bacterium 53_16]|jgi:metallo-beta-lactamase family protein|nr:MAG: RNA-metabolising metallo-beta-lactamase [Synergistales bacterium 53_16]KUL03764.1 MAG: RNA-metabolising metallo-beta-lactamase [Synergistales bacterium 54_9]MDK2845966.1 metallo-beta-lactamase family protein [Synergistales bacterium]MDN5336360.1 metallo-beta-lactamase family protein [Synergistales bacterium]